jgi:hypothetical protein
VFLKKNEPFSPLAHWRFTCDLLILSQVRDTFGHKNEQNKKIRMFYPVTSRRFPVAPGRSQALDFLLLVS